MTHKQERALQALLTSRTVKEAAEKAGTTDNTIRRYMKDPEFITVYKERVSEIMEAATRNLQQNFSAAIDRLGRIVANDEESSTNHIAAARALLDYGLRFTEFNDVLSELEATEGGTDVL